MTKEVWPEPGALRTVTPEAEGLYVPADFDNPTSIEVLGADLLWSSPALGTWVWSGGGGGAGWAHISNAVATEIVGTGAVK